MFKNLKYKIIWLVFIVGLLYPIQSYAQKDGEYGTTMNISIGPGARAMGLGRAYVAVANDPTAMFWNPAGLELAPRSALTLFHNQLIEGSMHDFIGFVYPTLTYGTVGLGYSRIGTGDIHAFDTNDVLEGEMNYEESEFYVSYAKKLPYNIYGGTTFKIRRHSFSFVDRDATGLGVDIGLMYRPEWENNILRNLAFGLSYRNLVSPALKLGAGTDHEPFHLTFGLIKGFEIGQTNELNIVFDYHKSRDETGSILAGTEYLYKELGSFRVGLDNMNFSFGAGLKYSLVTIDYAFGSTISDGEFPPTHRFSISFDIGKSREELFLIAEEERRQRERELVERTQEQERLNLVRESMQKGYEYLEEKRYFDAYAEFQQVVSADPFHKEANILIDSTNRMILKEFDKRQEEAIASALDKGLAEENRKFVQLHFEKGNVFLQNKQYTDALVEFNLSLERSPNDPIIKEAIATTERRMQADVRDLIAQGREQFQNGNYSAALQILSEALVLAPEEPELKEEINTLANRIKIQQYVEQALQYYDLGEYQNALSLFEEALKMDPTNQRLRQYIQRTKRGMGIVDEAMDQESESRYIQGVDLFLAGRYEEALVIWRELIEKYPYSKKLQDAIKSAEDRVKGRK
jgi:tetratricopeptide (TPR) repeat protein